MARNRADSQLFLKFEVKLSHLEYLIQILTLEKT